MSQIKQTIQAMHRRDTLNMLFWLGWLLIVGEIFISVRFQLLFATTPDEQAVAVLYGIGIPLATVAFFKLSIIFHDKRFMLAAFSLFLLLFFWGWHTQYSYLLNETDTKDNSGRVSVLQNEHLKTLDERLKNLPVVGAVFQDSSDSQIKTLEEQLSRCPNGQTTVCKKPLMQKIEALQIKRERNGTAAMVHQERDSILKEKDRALRSMTGLDADMENAKVMSVYKGISWMVNKMGGNCSPKEAEYLASIIGTFLYTVLSCGIWGFRTKLIMESSEESPARFDRVNYQAENTDAEEARLWNRVQNAAPVYRQKATQAAGNIGDRLRQAMQKHATAQNVNQGVNMQNVNRVVSLVKTPREPASVNLNAEYGRSELIEYDDDEIKFTDSPKHYDGMGFMATAINETAKPVAVEIEKREQVFTPDREQVCTLEREPESVNRVVSLVKVKREPISVSREPVERQAREHQKSFADLADEIVNGTYFKGRKVSLRGVKEFMACRTEIAREFRNRLISEEIITEKGEVHHGE